MPGKWVGGPGSLACPQRGQFIEAKVYDDSKKDQGTIFVEVKRLFGTGSSGRTFLGDLVTATDEYYRFWAASPDGVPTTVDGSYHLCRNDPRSCEGGAAGTTVVHLGKWRTWTEEELVAGKVAHLPKEAVTMLNRFFKEARREEPERRVSRGGLPWGEGKLDLAKKKDEDKVNREEAMGKKTAAKKERITVLEKELRALKADVERETKEPGRRSRSPAPRKSHPSVKDAKKKRPFEVGGFDKEKELEEEEDNDSSESGDKEASSERHSPVPKEDREKEKKIRRKAEQAKDKKRKKSKDEKKRKKGQGKKEKDRGPFGIAPTEEWE